MREDLAELASPVTFTSAGAIEVISGVCESAAVSFEGVQILQQPADNAMIVVPSVGLVARIGVDVSHRDRLAKELRTASWLAARGLATPEPAAWTPCPQLTVAQGRVVTWWQYVPSCEHSDLPGLMRLLRQLHDIPGPLPTLPAFDPWARMASQLRAATGLPERDRVRLEECWSELRSQWSRSRWPSESGVVVHGDAHTLNTLVHDSQVYLLDLEDVKLGPWQWDVISPLVYMRAGWITTADYQAAIDAYGRDPLAEGDIDVLVSIRLLRMTCWLASRTGREPVLVEKVLRRIACLEDPTLLERRPSEF